MGTMMGSTRRRFTDEYKKSAVEFVLDGGRPVVQVAKDVGVNATTLGNWVRKEREARGAEPPRPLDADERAELERLRDEVRRLRMEAEFAKKVAAWFAKDQQ
jgi:transposase